MGAFQSRDNVVVDVRFGVPPQWSEHVVEIYYEAFAPQLERLLGSGDRCRQLLRASLACDQALIAVCEESIVGLAGLHYDRRRFLAPTLSTLQSTQGWGRGLLVYGLWHSSQVAKGDRDELVLEALAVPQERRGQGIGTLLLQEVESFAQQNRFTSIRLEVTAENRRARVLYQRMGYQEGQSSQNPWVNYFLGLPPRIMMAKAIAP
ncbi:MAG: GNAT family N-acetyltransferase [Oscillatoriales cyanobacterium SM2_2_1]|nr:GNAT family N-acetyltransferase [Oscillatoriales cyanobacterium SM2_2_1]